MLKSELLTRNTPSIPDTVLYSGNVHRLENLNNPCNIEQNWLNETFKAQVRLGTGAEDRNLLYPSPRIIKVENTTEDVISGISVTVYNPDRKFYQNALIQKFPFLSDRWGIREQKLSLLLNPEFRAGSFSIIDDIFIRRLNAAIDYSVEIQLPIEIIILSLPFKDQNPVTTGHSPGFTDLGEELFISRLGSLCKSFESVGGNLKIRILSDVNVYKDIFVPDSKDVEEYVLNCRRIVEKLGLKTKISIQDINELVNLDNRFSEVRQLIENRISQLLSQDDSAEFNSNFNGLRRGLLFNLQLPEFENDYDRFIYLASLPDEALKVESQNVWDRLNNAALKYASFLLTMNNLKIIKRAYPFMSQIRGTVHPKPGQLGIKFGESSIAPYNGIPILDSRKYQNTGNLQKSVRIERLWKIYNDPKIVACFKENDDEPYYYKK